MMTRLESPDSYTVGWIAALPIERTAATAFLDDRHEAPEGFSQHQSDENSYTWGRIGKHNVVIVLLPAGLYQTTSAATAVSYFLSSVPQIRIGLLVGIGGGIPRPANNRDIRLGDVVVGLSHATTIGVVEYDLGNIGKKELWWRKSSAHIPPRMLRSALSIQRARHEFGVSAVPDLLQAMWTANPQMRTSRNNTPAFIHQGFENDRLFKPERDHADGNTCSDCDVSWEVQREQRDTTDPEIHYGVIASGNIVIKDAITRDQIAEATGEACICFDLGATGLVEHLPCLVIRGICDYTDSHKNNRWQRYASATAAAVAKELLGLVQTMQLEAEPRVSEMFQFTGDDVKNTQFGIHNVKEEVQSLRTVRLDANQEMVILRLENKVAVEATFDSLAEEHNSTCLPNTRVDLLQQISAWAVDPDTEAIFWLTGMPGSGKSTISRTMAQSFASENRLGASFFFKRGDPLRAGMTRFFPTIVADLTKRQPAIARYVKDAIERDPEIFTKTTSVQFNKLILQPLSTIQRKEPIVIVVDALDECEHDDDVRLTLIHLFSQVGALRSARLKIFLTSRSELPIRLGLEAIEDKHQGVTLDNIPEPVVKHDIFAFFQHQFARIRDEYNDSVSEDQQLAGDWPEEPVIRALTDMAPPLFIIAASICHSLVDRRIGNPDEILQKILQLHIANLSSWEEFRTMLALGVMTEESPIVASSGSRTKDLERDSGYASLSRPATLTVSSGPAFQDAPQPPTSDSMSATTQPPDEIESLASDEDDIGSEASNETTRAGMDGKGLIGKFLAEEPQFRGLCERAMAKIDRHRLIENLRRLLKSFHKSLTNEAVTEAQKAIARLLRSRRGRRRISWQVATNIQELREEGSRVQEPSLEGKHDIEAWLAQVSDTKPGEDQRRTPAFDIDNESLESSSDDEFPYITGLEAFLRESQSFRTLQRDFMLIFFPFELRHVLLSIPPESIWVSQEQNISLSNRLKGWVEDNTQVRWNWWPLESRQRMLRDDESRMFWRCTCGVRRWAEISNEQHELVTRILAQSEKPQATYGCRIKRDRVSFVTWLHRRWRIIVSTTRAASPSSAAQKYTPAGTTSITSTLRHGVLPTGHNPSSSLTPVQPHQPSGSITVTGAPASGPDPGGLTQAWILFGVKGSRKTLELAQIPVDSQTTDYSAFQALKKCYQAHRGRLRLWFSIWRLDNCEVVKFNKLTRERLVREHRDLPIHQEYQYSPRAGANGATNPPISRHTFEALVYTCPYPCTWLFPHDCMAPPTGDTFLKRVPKRTKSFKEDQTSPIWGFEAVLVVSPTYIVVYHCLMVAGPLAVWVWWLKFHPDDLQNAAIPLTVVIGLLSLFWSGGGILTSKRGD